MDETSDFLKFNTLKKFIKEYHFPKVVCVNNSNVKYLFN